jgi:plastocyanin
LRAAADILAPVLAASEPSKVPFYVAGSVLAAWAVVVSFIGITQPDFPGTGARARVVMGLSAVLVLCTVGTAISTSTKHHAEGEEAKAGEPAQEQPGQAPPPGGGGGATVRLTADPSGQLAYEQKTATAKAGKVTIDFDNPAPVAHDVTVIQGSRKLGATKVITASKTRVDVNLQAGSYTYYCSVDAHRQAGMEGQLTVR